MLLAHGVMPTVTLLTAGMPIIPPLANAGRTEQDFNQGDAQRPSLIRSPEDGLGLPEARDESIAEEESSGAEMSLSSSDEREPSNSSAARLSAAAVAELDYDYDEEFSPRGSGDLLRALKRRFRNGNNPAGHKSIAYSLHDSSVRRSRLEGLTCKQIHS